MDLLFPHEYKEEHDRVYDYFISVVFITLNASFVIGSVFFGSSSDFYLAIADWIFIVGSIVNVIINSWSMYHHLHAHYYSEMEEEEADMLLEEFWFLISGIIFAVGCIFFMPHLFSGTWAKSTGTYLCVLGSLSMCFAVLFAAFGLAAEHHEAKPIAAVAVMYKLKTIGLFASMMGSVFFTVGSFMYRPAFKEPLVSHYGVVMYVAGSLAFLFQSVLAFVCTIIRAQTTTQSKASERTRLLRGSGRLSAPALLEHVPMKLKKRMVKQRKNMFTG